MCSFSCGKASTTACKSASACSTAGKAGKAGCGCQDGYASPLHQGGNLSIAIAISGPGAGQLLSGPGSAKQKLTNLIAGVLSQGQNQGMASYGMQPGFGGYMNCFGRAGF